MTRSRWLLATPHCADGHPMRYDAELNRWFCMLDGAEVRGDLLARELGFDSRMRFAKDAA